MGYDGHCPSTCLGSSEEDCFDCVLTQGSVSTSRWRYLVRSCPTHTIRFLLVWTNPAIHRRRTTSRAARPRSWWCSSTRTTVVSWSTRRSSTTWRTCSTSWPVTVGARRECRSTSRSGPPRARLPFYHNGKWFKVCPHVCRRFVTTL